MSIIYHSTLTLTCLPPMPPAQFTRRGICIYTYIYIYMYIFYLSCNVNLPPPPYAPLSDYKAWYQRPCSRRDLFFLYVVF